MPNEKDAKLEERIRAIINECDDIARKSQEIGEGIRALPRRIDIEVPPCLSTREGQDLFRQQLQPWRVVLRNGGWALLSARVVCEVSYWAGRSMTGLGLREAWRLARVR